ncbi:tetraether lipid synthase Tes [Thermofilum pendens]|uniref:Radical SAM domain protein n=1 Tax=Thermofilum pendens (strain DSM 2475 / Hrk 5) TaxID=368408 RepID=A1RY25_THEPD|nr:radical SAM protein [Thermofilum pendens]ABL78105.1 Radical SAM domain protein [Thermofilum pendens Hrk 5]
MTRQEALRAEEFRLDYSQLAGLSYEDIAKVAASVREKLMPRLGVDYKLYLSKRPPIKEGEELIAYTQSACPECNSLLTAVIFKREGKVFIRKVCPEHGEFEELYFGDAEMYERFRRYQRDGKGNVISHLPVTAPCPYNCGVCTRHRSHAALINIVLTNRCDLSCFYCFFFASKSGYIYEPSLEHIRYMLRQARLTEPVKPPAIQLTGGEPTLRDDLLEIIKMAREEGFTHIQLNTNGIRLAFDPELAVKVRQAGVNTVYMSFDGVSPFSNPKNHWEVPYALDNLRKAGLGVVLVPTVIKHYNLSEVGKIIQFGLQNNDIVRGVNFQPVSIVGRMPRKERDKERVTIPDVIKAIEEQTGGQIKAEDWYPVPSVVPISRFVEALTGKPQLAFTTHFACGAATYVWQEDGEIIPITRFVHVDEFFRFLDAKADELEKGKNKYLVMLELMWNLRKFVDASKAPRRLREGNRLLKILYRVFVKHDYESLGEFHYNTLFLGMMHFQDLYNHDVARVMRCDIHYVMPDGRQVPFCSFNVLPDLYRDRAQRVFSYSIKDWEKLTGKRLVEDHYKRNIKKLISGEPYRRHYSKIIDIDSIPYEQHVLASKRFGIPVIE